MNLRLPLSLSLLQHPFLWMKLYIFRGLLRKYMHPLISQLKLQVPHGLKVELKYPLFHTALFNVDVTFSSKLPSLLHNKIQNKHLFYTQKELCEGNVGNTF